jgi:hypothetical protein
MDLPGAVEDLPGPDVPGELPPVFRDATLLAVLVAATGLGLAHHVDHVVRGNHVGWPLTGEVNPFTYSLAIYPAVALGVYLTLSERVGTGYWAGLLSVSALLLAWVHLSPWAVEPPADVVGPHASPVVGWAAFALLVALVTVVSVGAVYALVRWRREATA